jgi:hypothetical protein
MLEKADAAEMPEKADAEMAEMADMAVEKGDALGPWCPIWKHDVFL